MTMRWLLLLAAICGILIGPYLAALPGFVVIGYQQTTVELRLSLALAISVVASMALLMLGASAGFLTSIDKHVRRFTRAQRRKMSRQQTEEGLRALSEGRWSEAEQQLLKAARGNDHKLINYLGAAMAAQELNALERRDAHLAHAQAAEPGADLAVGMTQARLHLRSGHYDMAAAVLWQIESFYPRHAPALKLLQHVLRETGQYDALQRLYPRLQKYGVLPPARLQKIENELLQRRFQQEHDQSLIRAIWRSLSKQQRRDPANFQHYVQALLRVNAVQEAERLTRKWLATDWRSDLVSLYGHIPGRDTGAQLAHAEQWLHRRESDAAMLLCLARLAIRAQQWLKAQRYLNQYVSRYASNEAYLMLADVYEKLQEPDQMLACLRLALKPELANPIKREMK